MSCPRCKSKAWLCPCCGYCVDCCVCARVTYPESSHRVMHSFFHRTNLSNLYYLCENLWVFHSTGYGGKRACTMPSSAFSFGGGV